MEIPAGFGWRGLPRTFDGYCPHRTQVMRITIRRDDARSEELANLRLALVTFALQLDAFEVRADEVLKAGIRPETAVPARDAGRNLQKEE